MAEHRETEEAELRLVRQISPTDAKITILVRPKDTDFLPTPVTVYLHFYDGSWTSTRFEPRTGDSHNTRPDSAVRMLLLAIDELGEK